MRNLVILAGLLIGGACTHNPRFIEPLASIPAPERSPQVVVYTDPACSPSLETPFADVDDCLGLIMLQRLAIPIAAITATRGNHSEATALTSAAALGLQVYTDSTECTAAHVQAFTEAAKGGPLTVLAFGPLTGLATVFRCYPEMVHAVTEVIFVGGRRPGEELVVRQGFRPLRDLNVEVASSAVNDVLRSGVAMTLIPFEAGRLVPINMDDPRFGYSSLPPHVLEAARRWGTLTSMFWGTQGHILPFDPVAVAYTLWPNQFSCVPSQVRLEGTGPVQLIALPLILPQQVRMCVPRSPEYLRSLLVSVLMR